MKLRNKICKFLLQRINCMQMTEERIDTMVKYKSENIDQLNYSLGSIAKAFKLLVNDLRDVDDKIMVELYDHQEHWYNLSERMLKAVERLEKRIIDIERKL